MQKMLSLARSILTFEKFPYLTILSNIFLGYAFGRIVMTPAYELPENLWIKVFLVIGTCLFFNYLSCVRRAAKGITRTIHGRLRPFLRETFLCAALNGFVFLLSMSSFFFKSLYL